ncbi:THUMP-like domain-containing protein [Brachybacterium huguangmaarense]
MTDPATTETARTDPAEDAFATGLARVLDPAGWDLLQSLPPYTEQDALALGGSLRRAGHDGELVAAVLTQARLRAKGVEKFGDFAADMLFTPRGLEQATRLPIAALHARRFVDAGVPSIADLGCGIGGDAMAAAALGLDVTAVDRDPVTVAVATVNLRPFPDARAELGDAEAFDPARVGGIWMDPARRTVRGPARRLHDPEEYSPPLSAVTRIAEAVGALGVKLGPGIDHADLPAGTETQWISWHGQVLEADCWFGPLAAPGVRRSALVVGPGGAARLTDADGAVDDPDPGPLGAYLHEPDGAVIRAGLIGRLARDLGARTIDPTIAYLTSDALPEDASGPAAEALRFVQSYEVLDVLPFSLKRLTSYLRERGIGVLEIKKRGTAVEPDELRRRLRPRRFGDGSATVILTRVAGEQSAIIARPLGRDGHATGTAR